MFSTTWILEENVFAESCFDNMINVFEQFEIPFHTIKVKPFEHSIIGQVPNISTKNVVLYGSLGMHELAKKHNWNPGVWSDLECFNCGKFFDKYKNDYINNNYITGNFSKIEELVKVASSLWNDYYIFIKPYYDNKKFAGEIAQLDSLVAWKDRLMNIGYLEDDDFKVMLSPPDFSIDKEYRFIVVDNIIVAGSQYRNKYGVYVRDISYISPEVRDFVIRMINKYSPAKVFSIDIGETDSGYKVIECNTFNSSGLYACDVQNIILSINRMLQYG